MESHKKALLEELCVLDGLEEERALVAKEKLRKTMAISELKKVILLEEICWRQKSKALSLKDGDKSTKFFHWVANSTRRNNSLNRCQ
jgi:hypothetical protein